MGHRPKLGSYGKNRIFWPKTEILGPKKKLTSWGKPCSGHDRKKFFKEKSAFAHVALSSVHQPKTPAYASKQKSKKFSSGIYISSNNSAHNQYQKDVIEICTGNLPKRFMHEGFREVLDEGIGGSLKTHLQEVCYQAARVNKV